MRHVSIVLYGQGGELDRDTLPIRPEQDSGAVIRSRLESLLADREWSLAVGDTIKIEGTAED